jgi:outer membrane immunogenic protein
MKTLLCAGLAVSGSLMQAAAADLPTYSTPLAPTFVWSWTGLYVGVNAGWIGSTGPGVITNAGTDTGQSGLGSAVVAGIIPRSFNLNEDGFLGGAQIGYNWLFSSNWVLGVETDFDETVGARNATAFSFSGNRAFPALSTNYSRQLDALGTVRGRVGFAVAPDQLWYVTGGLAYGADKIGSAFICAACNPPTSTESNASTQTSSAALGWSVGAGLEWKFAPAWSLKAEYLFINLSNPTNAITYNYAGNLSSLRSSVTERDSLVRLGINYKLF